MDGNDDRSLDPDQRRTRRDRDVRRPRQRLDRPAGPVPHRLANGRRRLRDAREPLPGPDGRDVRPAGRRAQRQGRPHDRVDAGAARRRHPRGDRGAGPWPGRPLREQRWRGQRAGPRRPPHGRRPDPRRSRTAARRVAAGPGGSLRGDGGHRDDLPARWHGPCDGQIHHARHASGRCAGRLRRSPGRSRHVRPADAGRRLPDRPSRRPEHHHLHPLRARLRCDSRCSHADRDGNRCHERRNARPSRWTGRGGAPWRSAGHIPRQPRRVPGRRIWLDRRAGCVRGEAARGARRQRLTVAGLAADPTGYPDGSIRSSRERMGTTARSGKESRRRLVGRRAETEALEALLSNAVKGTSGVLVLHGEAGIGKSALLEHVAAHAAECRIARVSGVESEMELAYGGLQQICAPLLGGLGGLPEPQREALETAFGMRVGPAPDRFLVGLAVLNLLASAAEDRPLVCVIDDGQWLDLVSAQTIAFVARRLLAEHIALVVAVRDPVDETEFRALPRLEVRGLATDDATELLDSVLNGPVDPRVRDRIIEETLGNPLALLELPRAWTTAELADVLDRPGAMPVSGRVEEAFLRQLEALPPESRRLLLVAAAEPLGDATILWRAAAALGLGPDAATPAESAGLIWFRDRVRFRHPLVRAVAYRTASPSDRQAAHRALAEATDADVDPDRRAWHRSQTTLQPDEAIAAELERSADRARARGGSVAASAMLERASRLTPDPAERMRRTLAAAWAKRDAGQLESALGLLAEAQGGPAGALRPGDVDRLRGQIAFDQRRETDAVALLLAGARQMEAAAKAAAREGYLDALVVALWASGADAAEVLGVAATAARSAPAPAGPPDASDLVLDALASRLTDGYAAAQPLLARALESIRALRPGADDPGQLLGLNGS